MNISREKFNKIEKELKVIDVHTHLLMSSSLNRTGLIFKRFPQVVEVKSSDSENYSDFTCILDDGRQAIITIVSTMGMGVFYRINFKGDLQSLKQEVIL